MKIRVVITSLRSDQPVYSRDMTINFGEKLQGVRYLLRLSEVSFPEPGAYSIVLTADGEWLAETVLAISD